MTSQHDVINKTTVSDLHKCMVQHPNNFGFQHSLCA